MLPQEKVDEDIRDPRQAAVLLKEGVVAFRAGDKERAREILAQAAENDPHNELVWMWSASVARNRREALAALDRVLELNPSNEKAQQWLQRLRPAPPASAPGAAEPAPPKKPPLTVESAEGEESGPAPAARAENTVAPEAAPPAAAKVEPAASPSPAPRPTLVEKRPAETSLPPPARPSRHSAEEDDPIRALFAGAGRASAPPEESREEPATEPVREDEAHREPEQQQEAAEELIAAVSTVVEESPSRESGGPEATPRQDESAKPESFGVGSGAAVAPAREEPAKVHAHRADEAVVDAVQRLGGVRPISTETCLLCGKRSLENGVCGFCRAVSDISQLDAISRNDQVDRTVMLAAVERFRKELEAGQSFEANLGLALAYLNLKQSNDALPRLREACRLQPEHAELQRQYERLKARPLILAVDDSKTVQKMIAGVLESQLYRVVLAEDGLQALARLDDETPSLILLDITMPRMDGYQVSRIITGNAATASIPVLMLSGKDGFFDRIRGKMAGASGYLTKPFDPADLLETIQRCLKN